MDIFIVNATPRSETLANLNRYLVDKIPVLFVTLKAWEDKLSLHRQEGPRMKGTFVEDVRGFTLLERTQAHTHAQVILQEEQVPVARLVLNLKKLLHHNKVLDKAIMKELGWKKYGDNTNTPDVPYIGEGGLRKTKWVCYDTRSPNPIIEGTNGPDDPIYTQDLHAAPQLHPNFNEAKGFQDDRLQIFHPTFKSRPLVDHALGELDDMGLRGEVNRFRYWANEQDKKHQ
jgi:hypothetical protein